LTLGSPNGLPDYKANFALNSGLDLGNIDVQMVNDDPNHMVRAMTLNAHPLVGVRRWGVVKKDTSAPGSIEFFTDAWEMPSGAVNDAMMEILGRQLQEQMWRRYLNNFAAAWTGREGAVWLPPMVLDTVPEYLNGSATNPFRSQLPAALQ
jgi:hypothetical protein